MGSFVDRTEGVAVLLSLGRDRLLAAAAVVAALSAAGWLGSLGLA